MNNQNTGGKSPERANLTNWFRGLTGPAVTRLARGLIRIGITANGLTIMGLLLVCVAALLASQGQLSYAGLVYLLAGPFDGLDGAVARESGKASNFGALLDSTLDRYGEALLLTGIGYWLAKQGDNAAVVIAFFALFGSIMVSYARARSEGLGVDFKGGLFTRVERVIVLGLGLLLSLVSPALILLAIFTHVTVAQRLLHVYNASQVDS